MTCLRWRVNPAHTPKLPKHFFNTRPRIHSAMADRDKDDSLVELTAKVSAMGDKNEKMEPASTTTTSTLKEVNMAWSCIKYNGQCTREELALHIGSWSNKNPKAEIAEAVKNNEIKMVEKGEYDDLDDVFDLVSKADDPYKDVEPLEIDED